MRDDTGLNPRGEIQGIKRCLGEFMVPSINGLAGTWGERETGELVGGSEKQAQALVLSPESDFPGTRAPSFPWGSVLSGCHGGEVRQTASREA